MGYLHVIAVLATADAAALAEIRVVVDDALLQAAPLPDGLVEAVLLPVEAAHQRAERERQQVGRAARSGCSREVPHANQPGVIRQ